MCYVAIPVALYITGIKFLPVMPCAVILVLARAQQEQQYAHFPHAIKIGKAPIRYLALAFRSTLR
jgi:hypothetical protein